MCSCVFFVVVTNRVLFCFCCEFVFVYSFMQQQCFLCCFSIMYYYYYLCICICVAIVFLLSEWLPLLPPCCPNKPSRNSRAANIVLHIFPFLIESQNILILKNIPRNSRAANIVLFGSNHKIFH